MADQKLRFIAEWVDRGLKRGAKDAGKEVGNLEKSSGSLALQLGAVIAAAGSAAVALKKVYDVAKQGAQIELTAAKFDRLAESIGTTGDVLRGDLSIATQGMMSDAEQMALATDLMSLGLAKTRDQAIRLTTVASQLGMNMNQLVLTLTNRTTMRFDALGVAVDGFDDKVKNLEASGLSVEDAFTEAFLQQAEEQIEKVGSIADTTAGSIMRLEAQTKNLGDALKVATSQALGPFLDSWGKLLQMTNEGDIGRWEASWRNAGAAIGIGRDKIDELYDEAQRVKVADSDLKDFTYSLEDLAQAGREGIDPMQELAGATEDFSVSLDDANLSLDNFISKTMDQIKWIESGGLALQDMAKAIASEYDPALGNAEETMAKLRVVGIETISKLDNLSLNQIQSQFEDLGFTEEEALRLANAIYWRLKSLDGLKAYADIFITTHGSVPRITGNQQTSTGSGFGGEEPPDDRIPQQAGGDFIVPPSFTGDSFPVRATAGERVKTTTASNTRQDSLVGRIRERQTVDRLAAKITEGILIGMG